MDKKWISLYVENEVGVLAKIAGLFSARAYNLQSLTVGPTKDRTVSRITIGVLSDDQTYEQIKKQLNRCIEVIKVLDITDSAEYLKELMLIKLTGLPEGGLQQAADMMSGLPVRIIRKSEAGLLIESVMNEADHERLLKRLEEWTDKVEVEIVRGGSVGIQF